MDAIAGVVGEIVRGGVIVGDARVCSVEQAMERARDLLCFLGSCAVSKNINTIRKSNKKTTPNARHDAISHKHFVRGCVERMTKEDKEGGEEVRSDEERSDWRRNMHALVPPYRMRLLRDQRNNSHPSSQPFLRFASRTTVLEGF